MDQAINTAQQSGAISQLITIESTFTKGFNGIKLLGNITEVGRNGLERAKAALEEIGFEIPKRSIVVSLSPADVRKEGNQMDLGYAISLCLLANQEKTAKDLSQWVFTAELGITGHLKPVKGVISYGIKAAIQGMEGIIVAKQNLAEMQVLNSLESEHAPLQVLGFETLEQVLNWAYGDFVEIQPFVLPRIDPSRSELNFDDMLLTPEQELMAMAVACGGHNILLSGTPGVGKSMFIQRLPALMPQLSPSVHKQVLLHHSLEFEKIEPSLMAGRPPFRNPHHQTSPQALLGTDSHPGEITLAHGGLLFLDEILEFRKDILEGLREPLQNHTITVTRAKGKTTWLAKVILCVAMNNCPCGWYGSKIKKCYCSSQQILAYRRRLSGPLLDRIDIHVNLPERKFSSRKLFQIPKSTVGKTSSLRERVQAAIQRMVHRNQTFQVEKNSNLASSHMVAASGLNDQQFQDLLKPIDHLPLSNRVILKILTVARTIADLHESPAIEEPHFNQAMAWQQHTAAQERGDYAYGLC